MKKVGSGGVVLFHPIMRYILPGRYNDVVCNFQNFTSFVKKIASEHKKNFDKSELRDILDVFLSEIEDTLKENTDRKDFVSDKSLIATAVFLFLAGTETSVTTLRWALLYLIMHPKVQAKVQHEIDTVVGRNRLPQWADRLNLPLHRSCSP